MSHLVEYVSGILEDNGITGYSVEYRDGKFYIGLMVDAAKPATDIINNMRKLNIQTILKKYLKEDQYVLETKYINVPEPKLDPEMLKEIKKYERHKPIH